MRRRLFRLPASESTVGRDNDEEIAFHIEARTAELIEQGSSPQDARRRAELEFGDVADALAELTSIDRVKLRRERRAVWWDALWYDIRIALRGLRLNVLFAAAVILTLGLGIGVNAAMFGLTDRLLLSAPAHVADAAEVVRVYHERRGDDRGTLSPVFSYPIYQALQENVPSFGELAAYTGSRRSILGTGVSAREVQVASATASFFALLGVQAEAGRFFTAADDALPSGRRVIVLSHGLWQQQFGGARSALGAMVTLDEERYEVVGVAARGFTGMELEPVHGWIPLSVHGHTVDSCCWHTSNGMLWLRLVARLAPGATVDVARQQARSVVNRTREATEESDGLSIVLGSAVVGRAPAVDDGVPQRSGRIALWLLGVSAIVLVIACANVANLLLARGARRQRETGVRIALGVGRVRLGVHVIVETLVFALAGTALGLLLAHWVGRIGRSLLLPGMEWSGSPVSGRVLAVAILGALFSTLLAGALPVVHALRSDAGRLTGSVRATSRRSATRAALVALQATLCVVLLVGAGLFVRSLQHASTRPLGFEPEHTVLFEWQTSGRDWSRARLHALYDAGLERVRALPQIEAAAIATTAPMWSALWGDIRVPGMDSVPLPDARENGPFVASVSPGYFAATGARIVRGRAFNERDVPGSPPVAIVTETMARMIWPTVNAIGRCFVHDADEERRPAWYREAAPCREVIGVVEDTRYRSVLDEPSMMYYLPIAQEPGFSMRALFVRPRGDHDAAIDAVRTALASLEPGLPHVRVSPLNDRVDPQIQPWRLGAALFTAFGVLALLLAALGLYGLVAYDVAQRRREFGVRVALGAGGVRLVRLVMRDVASLVVAGLVIGMVAAGLAAPFVEPLLFEVSARDPRVFLAVAGLLVVVAMTAAVLPAWRSAGVQPTEALRDD